MYACAFETGGGFFEECVLSVIRPAILLTHPHRAIRGSLHDSTVSV